MGWLYGDNFSWFGDRFDGYEHILPGTAGTVRFLKKLSERVSQSPLPDVRDRLIECEAVAVYEAKFFKNGEAEHEAIAKIFMQIPNVRYDNTVSNNPEDYVDQVAPVSTWCYREIDTLDSLTESGCSSTPKLYGWDAKVGDGSNNPWIKGGYLGIAIMEKLPGIPLSEIWYPRELSDKEQDRIHAAFKIAITELWAHGFDSVDPRRANLLWDSKNSKCYIIDFEDSCPVEGTNWDSMGDMWYLHWGLENRRLLERYRAY